MFNLILENGIIPSDWVKGNIIPTCIYNKAIKTNQLITDQSHY